MSGAEQWGNLSQGTWQSAVEMLQQRIAEIEVQLEMKQGNSGIKRGKGRPKKVAPSLQLLPPPVWMNVSQQHTNKGGGDNKGVVASRTVRSLAGQLQMAGDGDQVEAIGGGASASSGGANGRNGAPYYGITPNQRRKDEIVKRAVSLHHRMASSQALRFGDQMDGGGDQVEAIGGGASAFRRSPEMVSGGVNGRKEAPSYGITPNQRREDEIVKRDLSLVHRMTSSQAAHFGDQMDGGVGQVEAIGGGASGGQVQLAGASHYRSPVMVSGGGVSRNESSASAIVKRDLLSYGMPSSQDARSYDANEPPPPNMYKPEEASGIRSGTRTVPSLPTPLSRPKPLPNQFVVRSVPVNRNVAPSYSRSQVDGQWAPQKLKRRQTTPDTAAPVSATKRVCLKQLPASGAMLDPNPSMAYQNQNRPIRTHPLYDLPPLFEGDYNLRAYRMSAGGCVVTFNTSTAADGSKALLPINTTLIKNEVERLLYRLKVDGVSYGSLAEPQTDEEWAMLRMTKVMRCVLLKYFTDIMRNASNDRPMFLLKPMPTECDRSNVHATINDAPEPARSLIAHITRWLRLDSMPLDDQKELVDCALKTIADLLKPLRLGFDELDLHEPGAVQRCSSQQAVIKVEKRDHDYADGGGEG